MMPFNKALPSDVDAERMILGCILLWNELFKTTQPYLRGEDFFLDSHRFVWWAMEVLHEAGSPIDPITLQDALRRKGELLTIGGPAFIGTLVDGVPRFTNIDAYIEIVLRNSLARAGIRLGQQLQDQIFDGEEEPYAVLHDTQKRIEELRNQKRRTRGYLSLNAALNAAIADFNHACDGRKPGLRTGFVGLDKLLRDGGLSRGDYIIVAARTSRGKSTLSLQIAVNAARLQPEAVIAYFSLEQNETRLAKRLLAIEGQIPYTDYVEGRFSRDSYDAIFELEAISQQWNFPIIFKPKMKPSEIFAECYRLRAEYKRLDLIVVDYLGLLRPDTRDNSRNRELGEISKEIKALAGEFDCPVIAPHQVNREGGKEDRLQTYHLRDSGELEQDADIVAFINHVAEYEQRNECVLEIAKQREGATGCVRLFFDKNCGRFESAGEDYCSASEIDWKGTTGNAWSY